jgi:hypothetical protein
MSRPTNVLAASLVAVVALGIVYACQDGTVPTGPDLTVTKAPVPLTVTGSGSGGSGTVTGATGLNCVITLGVAAATGCSTNLPWKSTVVLTATPAAGDSFAGWSGACSGTGTCTVTMMQSRTVTARFNRGSSQFTLTVTGGGNGNGSASSAPAGISCQITGGVAGGTGCSSAYAGAPPSR